MKEKISDVFESLGAILLILMSILVFIQVMLRFIFQIPIPWIEELSNLLLIWLSYILLASTFFKNFHVRIDLIDELISRKVSYFLNLFIHFIGIILGIVTIQFIFYFFETQLNFGQSTPVMNIPMYIVVIPMLVGTGLTILYFIMQFLSDLKGLKYKRWEDKK